MRPASGADDAYFVVEQVRMILDRLYPQWREEHPTDGRGYRYTYLLEAIKSLIARIQVHEHTTKMLGGMDSSPQIAASSLHHLIWQAAAPQWSTGHRHEAVFAAAKAVNSMLQSKVGRRDVADAHLVKQAFSNDPAEPGKSRLRFPHIEDAQTAKSMVNGAREFGSGCFAAIRNPVGHLPNDQIELDDQTALERLAAWSLFARWIDEAQLERSAQPPA